MRRGAGWPALVLAGVLAACTGGDDGDAARERDALEEVGVDAVEVAEAWLDTYPALDDGARASLELAGTRRSLGATHVHYRQQFDGVPVRAAQLIVHVDDEGEVLGASDSLTQARPEPGVEQQLDEAAATEVANKAVPTEVTATTAANVVWLPDGETLRLGWSVQMATRNSAYTVWVDAVSGEVADAREIRMDQCEDAEAPAACIFVPDPVQASGGSRPGGAEADEFRRPVALQGLEDPESGSLVGEFVDLESPNDPNPPIREPDGIWDQGRDDPGFEAAMAYFWIDRTQRLIQDLGFTDVRNESFPVVPVEDSEIDNAFYTPALDTIFLGVGSNGIDAGEDAQVIIHEYGHAVLHDQVPDMIFSDAGGAYHEAFGDILAGLVTLPESQDPACLFAWFLGPFGDGGCGRRMDVDKAFPDDVVNEVHADGEIFVGAVFDVFEALLDDAGLTIDDCAGTDDCDEVRDRVLGIALSAHEFLTGTEDLREIAEAYRLADKAAFGGDDGVLLAEVFAAHGLDGGGDSIIDPDGNPTGLPAALEVAVDITHTFRGDLRVEVGVVDAEFGDLCTAVTLLEPVPGDSADNLSGTADLSATDCAAFAPPSPDQQWVLLVEDTAEEDVGQVNGFAVIVDGEPFLATGVPAPIADADPTGTAVIVDGSGDRVPQEGERAPGERGSGVPFVSLSVRHPFVGDLQIRAGVADPATGRVLCSVPVLEPNPRDGSDDVEGDVDMAACAEHFPPSSSAAWFLEVVDTAPEDEGTIERFEVFAPDGRLVGRADVPVPVPDDDPGGGLAVAG